jgi:cell division protein FtsB
MQSYGYRTQRKLPKPLAILKNRKISVMIGLVFVTVLMITFSNKGLLRRILLTRELADREAHIEELNRDIASLKQQRMLLASDQATIERVARETHGMIRKGEVVYRVRPASVTRLP